MKSDLQVVNSGGAAARFLNGDSGGATIFSLFAFLTCCMIAGIAMDGSNLYRQKERLVIAVDAAAQAGIVALSEKKTEAEVQNAALAAAEMNVPYAEVGKTSTGVGDVELVRYDPFTSTLVEGTPNAVKVTLHRNASVENPVRTGLLRIAGVESFDFSVTSVAYYGQPGRCTSSDGIYAKGTVTLTSGNHIGRSYCVHSETSVWMPQQNTFEFGAGVSMPSMADCQGKCVDSANPGIEDAVFTMNLDLPKVSDHIGIVTAAMLASSSELKTEVFKNKSVAPNFTALSDLRILSVADARRLVKGSVVSLTSAQFNDLMIATSGDLPSGLVYQVDCRDRGNGLGTSVSLGSSTDRRNAAETTSTIETVRGVVLITDCAIDVGRNARIDNSVVISTKISPSSVLTASSGAVVGDPLKNCDLDRKVYIMTMSGINVSSDFTASNVSFIVNGDINVAANSNSSEVEHFGTSFHAEGSIQIPSSHTFNGCAEDSSGLLPGIRTFKFVMPKA